MVVGLQIEPLVLALMGLEISKLQSFQLWCFYLTKIVFLQVENSIEDFTESKSNKAKIYDFHYKKLIGFSSPNY